MSKEYGIIKVKLGTDAEESTMVQFGDGMTGIQSLGYDNGDVGVVLCRDGNHNEPFGFNEEKNTYESSEEKIFLAFDNPKSIDVLIARLTEAKLYF
ncbi:hypothetical protein NVP1158O_12 [Vibrio phage 1.158.O._10N.261.45.E12]|nr:hypothetical protein NVP1158O_12 [Vibrio phage 1.158.O._10N.261.45.E12]